MKTIQTYWDKVDRSYLSLLLILLVVLLHVIGCAKPTTGIPADELTSELSAAPQGPDWVPADALRPAGF